MGKPEITIKLTIPGNNYYLDIYKEDNGKLLFEICSTDGEDAAGGGIVEIESDIFLESLNKLLSQ